MVQVNAKMVAEMFPLVEAYLVRLQEQVKNDYFGWNDKSSMADRKWAEENYPRLEIQYGTKYAKIIGNAHGSRSVFGFVDMTNGNVMKAASWAQPAKNFARGHVSDDAVKMSKIRWTGIS